MATPKSTKNLETFDPQGRRAWHEWLNRNHGSSPGIWLIIYKKNHEKQGLSLEDAVEEALCFGWIDSKLNVVDETRFKLLFTPRKPRSIWSKSNKQRVEKLIKQGLMTASGLEKIEAAKQDGSWNRLDSSEELRIPEDLRNALAADGMAQKNFGEYSNSTKKQILWWIESARKTETRTRRIEKVVKAAKKGKTNLFSE
jgi:uncharacterized protein YdeI (YjbR/CyaY-like superfamily)